MSEYLEKALHSRLASVAAVNDIVGARKYPLVLPQNPTLPAITYRRLSGEREEGMVASYGLAHPRIEINCWETTYTKVKALASAVHTALNRASWTEDTVSVLDGVIESEMDDYDEELSDSYRRVYRVIQDWILWYRE